jgi:hypothetical protein
MSCHDFEAFLKEAALGAPLLPDVEAHLAGCTRCRGFLSDERCLLAALQSALEAPAAAQPSEGFLRRVRERVAREQTVQARKWPVWVPAIAASIAIGLGLTAYRVVVPALPDTARTATSSASVGGGSVSLGGPPARTVSPPSAATESASAKSRSRPPSVRGPVLSRESAGRMVESAGRVALEVIVEPGQDEALDRLLDGLRSDRARAAFRVVSLDSDAPLPSLRSQDLPRFEAEPLEVKPVFAGEGRGGL